MPLAAVVAIAPAAAGEAPAALGRAVHAWLLARIAAFDPALAARLHAPDAPRPFTCSDARGLGRPLAGRVALDPARPGWFRLTALTDEMESALRRALPAPGERLTLAEAEFVVTGATTDPAEHPWAGQADYADLVQRCTLRGGPSPRAVTLRYASPTLFRSDGRDQPLPSPDLVFGGLLRRWNAFAPIALPEEALRYAAECVALGRFALRSRLVSFEAADKGAHVGCVGEARYRFLVGDAYWTRLMTLLAAYAFWCGVGYRTAVGLGQTRVIEEPGQGGWERENGTAIADDRAHSLLAQPA